MSVGLAASLAALHLGCGSSDDKGNGNPGGSAGAAGISGQGGSDATGGGGAGQGGSTSSQAGTGGAAGGTAGGGGMGGATTTAGAGGTSGAAPVGIASNLPNVDFQVTEGQGSDIQLVSSNLTLDTTGLNYVEWFAEVRNNGPLPACFVQAAVDFTDDAGTVIQSLMSYSTGDPYEISSPDSVSPCIPHGGSGVVWANDIPDVAPTIASIHVAKLKFTDSGLGATAVPHPSTPKLDSGIITQHSTLGPGYWSLTGQSTAVATIYNVKADVYFKSAAGVVVFNPDAFHMDTWLSGSAWNWETITGYGGTKPTSYLFYWSFLNGPKGAADVRHVSALSKQVAAAADAQSAWLTAADGRRDQAGATGK